MTGRKLVLRSLAAVLVAALFWALPGTAQGQAYIPYSDDFESGAFGSEWTLSNDPNGRIEVTAQYSPHGGIYHAAMDCINSGTYALNTLDLQIDLGGETQVELSYWYKEFGDENHVEDGLFISDDGINFHQVLSHNDGPTAWTRYVVDIDNEAAALGLTLSRDFVIRFSQYDNSPLTSDGVCIDDVSVDYPAIPVLECDVDTLSTSTGGVAVFTLHAGSAYAGREYLLLGSNTGTSPGVVLPSGATLPLNPGLFFYCVRTHINTANFVHFNGVFNSLGRSHAKMDSVGPGNPYAAGMHFDFAYTTVDPYDFQSNVVGIDIVP